MKVIICFFLIALIIVAILGFVKLFESLKSPAPTKITPIPTEIKKMLDEISHLNLKGTGLEDDFDRESAIMELLTNYSKLSDIKILDYSRRSSFVSGITYYYYFLEVKYFRFHFDFTDFGSFTIRPDDKPSFLYFDPHAYKPEYTKKLVRYLINNSEFESQF